MTDLILLPLDSSPAAEQAADRVVDVADERDAAIHALFIVDKRELGDPALCSTEVLIMEYEDGGHDLLTGLENRAHERGVPVETRLCRGDPCEEICAAVEKHDPDLTVLGVDIEGCKSVTRTMRQPVVREVCDAVENQEPALTVIGDDHQNEQDSAPLEEIEAFDHVIVH
ncbi:universal stress protein [Halococcoides cellulosivorans]|nr:universal stress protein [Halococcoides cellulosivorans]